jgi:hypothetical protein
MSKKKQTPGKTPVKPAPKKNTTMWLVLGAVALVVAVVGIMSVAGGSKGGVASAPAEEQKYIGRLLPKGYEEAKVADFAPYAQTVSISPVTATDAGTGISVALADVTSKKDVSFEYTRADGTPLPLLAYVKPSGKLFVGVNYCAPCQGKGQELNADGTLTCTTCGTKRNPETQVGISGGCRLYPLDELPATVAGGKIVIDKSVLDKWTAQPLDRKSGSQAG